MSKYSYYELIDAGAPELPDGYFYRIQRGPFKGTTYVHIRRRFGRWSYAVKKIWGRPDTEEELISLVWMVHRDSELGIDRTEVTRFYGDHP